MMTEMTAVPTSRRSATGVEDLSQGGDLVEPAGHEAVHPVGGPEDGQEDGGVGLAVGPEEQPDEERDAGQAEEGDEIRDGEDAAERFLVDRHLIRPCALGRHRRQSRTRRGGPRVFRPAAPGS